MNREAEKLLEQAALGELDAAGRIRLQALCAADPDLAERLRQEQRLSGILRQCGQNRAPAGLARSVFAALDQSTEIKVKVPRRAWWANPLLGWGACAAALAFIVIRPMLSDSTNISRTKADLRSLATSVNQREIASNFAQPEAEAAPPTAHFGETDGKLEFYASDGDEIRSDGDLDTVEMRGGSLDSTAIVRGEPAPAAEPQSDAMRVIATPQPMGTPAPDASSGLPPGDLRSDELPASKPALAAASTAVPSSGEKLGENASARAIARASTPAELAKVRLAQEFEADAPAAPAGIAGDQAVLESAVVAGEPPAPQKPVQPRVGLRIFLASRPLDPRAQPRRSGSTASSAFKQAAGDPAGNVRRSFNNNAVPIDEAQAGYSQKDIEVAVLLAGGKIERREAIPGDAKTSKLKVNLNPEQMREFLRILNDMGIRPGDTDKKRATVPARSLSQQYEVVEGEALYRMIEKGKPGTPQPTEAPKSGESLDMATAAGPDGRIDLSLTIQRVDD